MSLSKTLYHTCFIHGQECKWWSCLLNLTSSVNSEGKHHLHSIFCFNMLTFLPAFMDILSISWFVLQDAMSSPYQLLIWFRTTFLLLLMCEFHQHIVGVSHKLSSTKSYRWSTWKPLRLISKILRWWDILKLTQLTCSTIWLSCTLSSIFMPCWLPKRTPQAS